MIVLSRKLRPISDITDSLKEVDFDNFNFDLNIKTRNEFGYLAETLKVMGVRLKQASQEALERDRMTRELAIAKEIQRNMLPTNYPKNQRLEFAGIYTSAQEIGGDYYDFIDFGDGMTGYLVADVSGKSLPGMLVMLLTRDIVKRQARLIRNPAQLLVAVNEELLQNIKKGMFVTMFIALIDENRSKVTFASAGHNPLIVVNANDGKTELIKTKGFPLGMVNTSQFKNRIEYSERQLNPGDWLIQFTDGINEAQDKNNNEFGMERFVEAIEKNCYAEPKELIAKIMDAHKSFVQNALQYDDITLLVMKWQGQTVKNSSHREVYSYEKR